MVSLKRILLIAISGLFAFQAKAQTAESTFSDDDPIAIMLDSLANKKILEYAFSKPAFQKNNKYHFNEDSVPRFDDNVYEARLAKLDVLSPFDLVYNSHVKGFIELYAVRKRSMVTKMMGLAQLYYPMFEEVFDRYNIPLELKHLAVIESALNPNARSKAGAQGLWQFMYPTGKMYGLNVTSYIDERSDPYKATVSAAEYLKSLYTMFGDWQMVLAAYNAGPGTISKAIRRSGGKKTYWEIRPFLPKETQSYVPAFIAANYVMTYTAEHNLYAAVPRKTYFEVDTVIVKEPMTFEQIGAALDVPVDEVQYFNPQYRKGVIPPGGYSLCLQKAKIGAFINNEQQIYAAIKAQSLQSEGMANNIKEVQITHTVKSGEKLSTIARKYGVSVTDLKSWNYIGRKGIRPGKKLAVYIAKQVDSTPKLEVKPEEQNLASNGNNVEKKLAENTAANKELWYKVKGGETVFSIAKKYKLSADELREMNGLAAKQGLKKGQVLRVR
ncbi:MAG: transglycosylase SLT domain-containing protein [Bacteroidia bacterium]